MHIGSRSIGGSKPKGSDETIFATHDTSLKPTPNINLSSKPDGELP
jgi:hypothetical protein